MKKPELPQFRFLHGYFIHIDGSGGPGCQDQSQIGTIDHAVVIHVRTNVGRAPISQNLRDVASVDQTVTIDVTDKRVINAVDQAIESML